MNYKNIVVKVGTSTLTYNTGLMNFKHMELLARTIADLKNSGVNVTLVSSGAIGVGVGKLGLSHKPDSTRGKQAVAAVGQVELMNIYARMFGYYGTSIAQVLLTKDVVDDDERRENAEGTFETLLKLGVVPIVNENDTISTYEIEVGFGENDTLSAYVARLVKADLLIILSDIEGLYDSDPHKNPDAQLIGQVEKITDEIRAKAGGAGTNRGTGGMLTKLNAAEMAAEVGISTVIASGENPTILYDIVEGKPRGTFFCGGNTK